MDDDTRANNTAYNNDINSISYNLKDQSEATIQRRMHTLSQMFLGKDNKNQHDVQLMLDNCQDSNQLIVFQDTKGDVWEISRKADLKLENIVAHTNGY